MIQGILQHGLPSNSEKLLALKNKVYNSLFKEIFWYKGTVTFMCCFLYLSGNDKCFRAEVQCSGNREFHLETAIQCERSEHFGTSFLLSVAPAQQECVVLINKQTPQEFWKCDVDVEEQQVRSLYGLNSSEPNILFAMCCGTRSSPAVSSSAPNTTNKSIMFFFASNINELSFLKFPFNLNQLSN